MSALALDVSGLSALAAAILAAFLGSAHCLAMCGPLRVISGPGRRARIAYQGGRGIAYALLGTAAGAFGGSLPLWALLSLLAVSVILMIARVKWPLHRPAFADRAFALAANHPFFLGAFSGLLPCGLLHGWLLAAAATASPARGALVLGALWVGTLPALELAPAIAARPLKKFRTAFPRVAVFSAILLAAMPALWRAHMAYAEVKGGKAVSCHTPSSVIPSAP